MRWQKRICPATAVARWNKRNRHEGEAKHALNFLSFAMATLIEKQKKALKVTIDPAKHLGIIQFSRPEKLNSFISDQYLELAESIRGNLLTMLWD
jgi:hypothetical protein